MAGAANDTTRATAIRSFFKGVSPICVALGCERSYRLATWLDWNEALGNAHPPLLPNTCSLLIRCRKPQGIAFGYRVQSQPAFPLKAASADPPLYRRSRLFPAQATDKGENGHVTFHQQFTTWPRPSSCRCRRRRFRVCLARPCRRMPRRPEEAECPRGCRSQAG